MEQASKHTGGYDDRGPNQGYYGLEQSGKTSTIFVAPQGNGGGWANGGGSDIKFVDEINKQLDEGLCVNQNLRFALGFSWGAGMSNAVACTRADQFRGVALWNGGTLSGCDGGKKPIAWWSAHGVSDNVLGIDMGRQLRDNFVKINGCTPQKPAEPAAGSGQHITTEYKGCSAGHPVVWTAYDGGHIAEPKDKGAKDAWGPASIWSFFSRFK
jgi:poly(3-hydroxybutyrate) depolymerase